MAEAAVDGGETKSLLIEAEGVIKEVFTGVQFITYATSLPCTDAIVHLNMRTKEGQSYCVELTSRGYRIVSNEFGKIHVGVQGGDSEPPDSRTFETLHCLLDCISPEYRKSFGNALVEKLHKLSENEQAAYTT